MNAPKNVVSAARRVADKRKRAEQAKDTAALQRFIAGLDAEYLTKLKHDCLVTANTRLRGASPEEVVREAELHFESRVRFLMEKSS
jgi:hypothetical protein